MVESPKSMKLGIAMFPADTAVDPATLARLVEDLGFESLFFPEHSHIPASRESQVGPGEDELPAYYWRSRDLFISMASAAAATERLLIGSGLCLVAQRDPIWTAKSVATLDDLSGGRIIFGVGAGWNREEMEGHGYEFRTRFSRMREHVLAMKALWTEDQASFDGRNVTFVDALAWPKPRQAPYPPVLIGGAGPKVIERILDYGDGWLAEPADGLEERISSLAAQAAPGSASVTIYGADPGDLYRWFIPSVERCVFWVEPGPLEDTRQALARIAHQVGLKATG